MWMGLWPVLVGLWLWVNCVVIVTHADTHALDRQSTCGKTFPVFDSDLTLVARSNVAPANPPLTCIVYLESGYQAADGRSRLQIIVEQLQINDCSIFLDFFNGRGASGQTLRKLGCSSSSTDIIYSKDRLVTVRFTRPLNLYQTDYAITLTVRAYEDGDATGTEVGVAALSVGAIIGIVVGLLVVIAVAILLAWCCCTGYIHRFLGGSGKKGAPPHITYTPRSPYGAGSIDSNLEKTSTTSSTQQLNAMQGGMWGVSSSGQEGGGSFRRGVPRKAATRGYYSAPIDSIEHSRNDRLGRVPAYQTDPHVYEPYDNKDPQDNTSPKFRKRSDDPQLRARARESRSLRNPEGEPRETTIDDPGTASQGDVKGTEDCDEEETPNSLHREGSEVGVDTIASPLHVNAAVRASVPDLSTQPSDVCPPPSPLSKRPRGEGQGHHPDPMGLPPEAFDPVFTTSASEGLQWPGPQPPPVVPFMPYGMVPMVPGQHMYSYAYGAGGVQGAYFVQSVPTGEGDVRNTALAYASHRTPHTHQNHHHPQPPDLTSTPRGGGEAGKGGALAKPSLSRPSLQPSGPRRSVAVKSSADPDTGMQTTQVLWSDYMPHPSDPGPGDSSEVTRKSTTRITTRSGQGLLPQHTPLMEDPDLQPAFLDPLPGSPPPLPSAALTPTADNLDYYTGQRSVQAVPSHGPIREVGMKNGAIRDTVTLAESSVV